jgi:prepilin-type N-terminal cleavage/methylation domain-containing protein
MDLEPHATPDAGFTLIELIASLVLAGLLMAVAGLGVIQATQGYMMAAQNSHMTQKAYLAMARLSRELRALTNIIVYQTSGTGPLPGLIYERIDKDSGMLKRLAIARDADTIKLYELAADALTVSGAGDVLVDTVVTGAGGLDFAFFKADGDDPWSPVTDAIADLSRIVLTVKLARADLDGAGIAAVDFTTVIGPRNK